MDKSFISTPSSWKTIFPMNEIKLFDDKEISDNWDNEDEFNETELFGTEFQVGDVIEEVGQSQEMWNVHTNLYFFHVLLGKLR